MLTKCWLIVAQRVVKTSKYNLNSFVTNPWDYILECIILSVKFCAFLHLFLQPKTAMKVFLGVFLKKECFVLFIWYAVIYLAVRAFVFFLLRKFSILGYSSAVFWNAKLCLFNRSHILGSHVSSVRFSPRFYWHCWLGYVFVQKTRAFNRSLR